MDRMHFGSMFRKARRIAGLTPKALRLAYGLPKSSICHLETGHGNSTVVKYMKLADCIGYVLAISRGSTVVKLHNYESLGNWIKSLDKISPLAELSVKIGFEESYLRRVGTCNFEMTIDGFLNLCEIMGYKLSLIPKK